MPPKSRPKDGQVANKQLSDRDTHIQFEQNNPKRKGSAAAERYDKYKVARTVGDALDLGAGPGDLKHDLSKGHLQLNESDSRVRAPMPSLLFRPQALARPAASGNEVACAAPLRQASGSISDPSSSHSLASSSCQKLQPRLEKACGDSPVPTSTINSAAAADALAAAVVMPQQGLSGFLNTAMKPGCLLDRIQERRALTKPTASQVLDNAERQCVGEQCEENVKNNHDEQNKDMGDCESVAPHAQEPPKEDEMCMHVDSTNTSDNRDSVLEQENREPLHANAHHIPRQREDCTAEKKLETDAHAIDSLHAILATSELDIVPEQPALRKTMRVEPVAVLAHIPELSTPTLRVQPLLDRSTSSNAKSQGWSAVQSLQGWRPSNSSSLEMESKDGNRSADNTLVEQGLSSSSTSGNPQILASTHVTLGQASQELVPCNSSSASVIRMTSSKLIDESEGTPCPHLLSAEAASDRRSNLTNSCDDIGRVEPLVQKVELPDDVLNELEEALADTPLDPSSDEEHLAEHSHRNDEHLSFDEVPISPQESKAEDPSDSGIVNLDSGQDTIKLILRLGFITVKEELPDEEPPAGAEAALAGRVENGLQNVVSREVNVLQMLQNCPRGEEVEAEMEKERQDQQEQTDQLAQAQTASYEAHEAEKRDREARDRVQVEGGDFEPLFTRDPDLMEALLNCEGAFELLNEIDNRKLLWRYVQIQDRAKKWYKDAAQEYFLRQRQFLAECVGRNVFQHLQEVVERVETALFAMPEKGQQGLWGAYVPEIFAPQAATHSEGLVELD